jgi:hypothetical protein
LPGACAERERPEKAAAKHQTVRGRRSSPCGGSLHCAAGRARAPPSSRGLRAGDGASALSPRIARRPSSVQVSTSIRSAGAKAGTCEYSKRGASCSSIAHTWHVMSDSSQRSGQTRRGGSQRSASRLRRSAKLGLNLTFLGPSEATEGSTVGGLPFLLRNTLTC